MGRLLLLCLTVSLPISCGCQSSPQRLGQKNAPSETRDQVCKQNTRERNEQQETDPRDEIASHILKRKGIEPGSKQHRRLVAQNKMQREFRESHNLGDANHNLDHRMADQEMRRALEGY